MRSYVVANCDQMRHQAGADGVTSAARLTTTPFAKRLDRDWSFADGTFARNRVHQAEFVQRTAQAALRLRLAA